MIAKELRIGNWFIEKGDIKQFDGDFYNLLDMQPIELTEEWLIKFEFMQYIDFGVKMGTYDKMPLCGFTYSIHTKKVMIMHKGNSISHWLNINIDYVHQLQNIYFALTGEELTIKI